MGVTSAQGRFGPFVPLKTSRVPLWLALQLKQRNECSLVPPQWLSVEGLKQLLDEERRNEVFSAVPEHYQEFAAAIIKGWGRSAEGR